jgi:uncharacterized protein
LNFWDSSAVLPLLLGERSTPLAREILEADRQVHVWWGTEIECVSTIARLERNGIDSSVLAAALDRLSALREDWNEVNPGALIRDTARRLLRVHRLRGSDALQLAAAWILSDQSPASVSMVSFDDRLRNAASREGFRLLPERI